MNTLAEMKLVIKSEGGFMKVYFYINLNFILVFSLLEIILPIYIFKKI